MVCIAAVASNLGMSALGGAVAGAGLANMGGAIASRIGGLASAAPGLSALSSMKAVTSLNPAAEVNGVLGNLSSVAGVSNFGAGTLSGALSNAAGGSFSSIGSTLTGGLGSHAANLMGTGPIQAFQTFNGVEAFSNVSQSVAGTLKGVVGQQFGQAVSSITKTLPIGGATGDFGNFLGASIGDVQGMLTNGMSSLTNVVGDIPNFAGELGSLGTAFNVGNLTEFGNPGQLIQQINSAGGLEISGLGNALQEVGLGDVPISSLSNPIFNAELTDALGMIQNPQKIANAQTMLGSSIKGMESLADFTDMAKVMPASFDSIPFDNFQQLGEHLQSVELGSISNTGQLGGLLTSLNTVDIPNIINTSDTIDPTALSNLTSDFLGGSGPNGAILSSDMMGTLGGIGIRQQAIDYEEAINNLSAQGAFDDVNVLYGQIANAINGDYLDVPGDFGASTEHQDPEDSSTHTDLDSFVQNKQDQINSAIAAIASAYPTESAVASAAYTPILKQVYDEQQFAGRTDLRLDLRDEAKENAYHFVTNHQSRSARSDIIQIVEGMQDQAVQNGDKFGEYWRAFTAENKNRNAADTYNIRWRSENLEEFELI
jgi:hypothetical protein